MFKDSYLAQSLDFVVILFALSLSYLTGFFAQVCTKAISYCYSSSSDKLKQCDHLRIMIEARCIIEVSLTVREAVFFVRSMGFHFVSSLLMVLMLDFVSKSCWSSLPC